MRKLNDMEFDQVSGAFWPILGVIAGRFVVGSLVNVALYSFNKHHKNEPMTSQGLLTSAAFGGVLGGGAGSMARAAGGGLEGNVVWRPGFMAINASGLQNMYLRISSE